MVQPSVYRGGAGSSFGSPSGAPAATHLAMTSFSVSVRRRSFSNSPTVASACHGGMIPAATRAPIDRAQGRVSAYVMSDIGAICPGRWHDVQWLNSTGATSLLYVGLAGGVDCAPSRTVTNAPAVTRRATARSRLITSPSLTTMPEDSGRDATKSIGLPPNRHPSVRLIAAYPPRRRSASHSPLTGARSASWRHASRLRLRRRRRSTKPATTAARAEGRATRPSMDLPRKRMWFGVGRRIGWMCYEVYDRSEPVGHTRIRVIHRGRQNFGRRLPLQRPHESLTLAAVDHHVAVLLSVVAVTACISPVRRATRIDPLLALRVE